MYHSACIWENFVAVIDPQPGSDNTGDQLAIIWCPLTMRGGVRFAHANLGLGLQIPHFHFTIEIAKPSQTQESAQITPYDFVPVTNAKLENLLIVLTEHDRMGGHEPTDDNEVFALVVPAKIVHGAFKGLDFVDFAVLIIKYVQTILAVVWLACGIVVGLEFHQELVRLGAKAQLNLFSLLDSFLIEGLLGLMGKQPHQTWIGLLIQEQRRQQIIFTFADLTDFKELHWAGVQLLFEFPLGIINLDDFRVVPETFLVVGGEPN